MVAAAFFFSIMALLVKWAGQLGFPSHMLVLARAVVTLILSLAWLARSRVPVRGKRPGLLLLRGMTGTVALMCFYYSLTELPLADSTIIQYTNPLLTALLAGAVLRERMEPWQWIAASFSLAGILLVAQPGWLTGADEPRLPWFPVMIAFIGSVMSAVSYIIVRELRKTDEPMLIVAWFPFVAVPAVLPLVWMDPHWPEGWQWLLMAGIGVATQAGQIAMTRALHAETASRATGMSYVQIAFAFGWGLVIFGESIRWSSVVGALLIVAGTVGMGWWAGRSPARAGAPD